MSEGGGRAGERAVHQPVEAAGGGGVTEGGGRAGECAVRQQGGGGGGVTEGGGLAGEGAVQQQSEAAGSGGMAVGSSPGSGTYLGGKLSKESKSGKQGEQGRSLGGSGAAWGC